VGVLARFNLGGNDRQAVVPHAALGCPQVIGIGSEQANIVSVVCGSMRSHGFSKTNYGQATAEPHRQHAG
jgi:hypothetical protein